MHAPNFPEHLFQKSFIKALGEDVWNDFEKKFHKSFIQESDLENIAKAGFNFIRLPIHYKLLEPQAYQYSDYGFGIVDKVIRWAKKNRIWVLLDLHAAPGSQNHDWHSDSAGQAKLWKSKSCQQRTLKLWRHIAQRYSQEPAVAGYDLLNEPIVSSMSVLNDFYRRLIKEIRKVDQNHILFIEGNTWSTRVKDLENFEDDNYVVSIHSYEPLDTTFNYVPLLKYPGKHFSRENLRRHLEQYRDFSKKRNVPIHVGEFGVNYRANDCGEVDWLQDTLKYFNEFGFHWTYWTYKAIKNYAFPDGVYSYYGNPPWVNRPGPTQGWNTYKDHWPTKSKDMVHSWKTQQFEENTLVLRQLKNAAKGNHKPDKSTG